jgi:hypothetical protein
MAGGEVADFKIRSSPINYCQEANGSMLVLFKVSKSNARHD